MCCLWMSLTPTATFISDTEDKGKIGGIRKWTLTFAFVFFIGDIKLQGAEHAVPYWTTSVDFSDPYNLFKLILEDFAGLGWQCLIFCRINFGALSVVCISSEDTHFRCDGYVLKSPDTRCHDSYVIWRKVLSTFHRTSVGFFKSLGLYYAIICQTNWKVVSYIFLLHFLMSSVLRCITRSIERWILVPQLC